MKSVIYKEIKLKLICNFLFVVVNWVYNVCKLFVLLEVIEKVVMFILFVFVFEVFGVFVKRIFDVVCVVMLNSD